MAYADCHTHTNASLDCDAPIEDMLQAANGKGLFAVAVTDHVDLADSREVYDRARENSWRAMEQAAVPEGLTLLRGIELGEPASDTGLANHLLAEHPYDTVLASQHSVDNIDYYYRDYTHISDAEIIAQMRRYFEAVRDIVRWNGFDSLAHLTYPFRYMPKKWQNGDYRPWRDLIDDILSTLAENGKALEINTSGLRSRCGIPSPDKPLIERFRRLGGRYITLGSDAHRPQDVGADLSAAARLAREAGFTEAVFYLRRAPVPFSLGNGTGKDGAKKEEQ